MKLKCEICGEKLTKSPDSYRFHLLRFHGGLVEVPKYEVLSPKLTPTRTTNRCKSQIVFDIEKILGHAIFPMVKPWQSFTAA